LEVKVPDGRIRAQVGALETVVPVVVRVRVHVECRIPEWPTISHIVENATGQYVWVNTR
jgi:hypothetical protein